MAEFKTAYLQRVLPVDVVVVGSVNEGTKVTSANRKDAIMRGDFVVFKPANGDTPAYIEKATAAQLAAQAATHIVALSDLALEGRYVRTDLRDYSVSDLVGANKSAAPSGAYAVKKVGLYPIFDWEDIIPDADANDVKA